MRRTVGSPPWIMKSAMMRWKTVPMEGSQVSQHHGEGGRGRTLVVTPLRQLEKVPAGLWRMLVVQLEGDGTKVGLQDDRLRHAGRSREAKVGSESRRTEQVSGAWVGSGGPVRSLSELSSLFRRFPAGCERLVAAEPASELSLTLTAHSLATTTLDGAAEGCHCSIVASPTCHCRSNTPRLSPPRSPIFIACFFGQAILRDNAHLLRQCRCAVVETTDQTWSLMLVTEQRLTSAISTRNFSRTSTLGTLDGGILTRGRSCVPERTSMD